jgi:hypothetical protein
MKHPLFVELINEKNNKRVVYCMHLYIYGGLSFLFNYIIKNKIIIYLKLSKLNIQNINYFIFFVLLLLLFKREREKKYELLYFKLKYNVIYKKIIIFLHHHHHRQT